MSHPLALKTIHSLCVYACGVWTLIDMVCITKNSTDIFP